MCCVQHSVAVSLIELTAYQNAIFKIWEGFYSSFYVQNALLQMQVHDTNICLMFDIRHSL